MKTSNKLLSSILTLLLLITTQAFAENKAGQGVIQNDEAATSYQKGKTLYDQKNYNEAFPLLLKAAEMGNSDAQMHVGKMYYNGWGVGHSHGKGKEWHEKAAKQGNKESIQKLENMKTHKGSAH